MRSAVQQRDKEKAERATLVRQEKLIRAKVILLSRGVPWPAWLNQAAGAAALHCCMQCYSLLGLSTDPCGHTMFASFLQGRVYALPDVWIRPAFGGKGRKVGCGTGNFSWC